ncbi:hypothetical protein PUN28_015094 [Cardiocondyla obscurior]|uniref:Transmembrane protein n=1 Tax=Cardiocondyla obscurior TaxID=286306 RepID=A0AAW2EX61_9HYME
MSYTRGIRQADGPMPRAGFAAAEKKLRVREKRKPTRGSAPVTSGVARKEWRESNSIGRARNVDGFCILITCLSVSRIHLLRFLFFFIYFFYFLYISYFISPLLLYYASLDLLALFRGIIAIFIRKERKSYNENRILHICEFRLKLLQRGG